MNIVISGASRGLGAQLARIYAAPGVNLGLIARNEQSLKNVSQDCSNRGANTMLLSADVQEKESLSSWLLEFDSEFPVDLLICNAGVLHVLENGKIEEDMNRAREIFEVNFHGTISLVSILLGRMKQHRKGHIVIISSMSAFRGIPHFPAYSASKAALKSYFESLRPSLEVHGIKLTVICPGFIDTDMAGALNCPRPFMIGLNEAAATIKHCVDRNRKFVSFPLILALGARLATIMPESMINKIYSVIFKFHAKRS